MAFLVGGANSLTAGYDIDNSLRFNSADSPDLRITPGSASDTKTWTFSCWVKRGNLTNYFSLLSAMKSGGQAGSFRLILWNDDTLVISDWYDKQLYTSALYRDTSAWMHIVLAWDTTQSTEANRVKLYVNGSQVTLNENTGASGWAGYPAEDAVTYINDAEAHAISSRQPYHASNYLDGYLADVYFIDGTAYDADDFGETDGDSGIWKPKAASVTFGTNGFFLEFKGTGTDQDASGIGADTSGEDNHLAVTNLAATDQTTDTPTNNFCTLNPLMNSSQATYSEGNLDEACNDNFGVGGSMAVANGKWYWEVKIKAGDNNLVGIANGDEVWRFYVIAGIVNYSISVYGVNGKIYKEGSEIEDVADTYGADDIIGVRLDLDSATRTVAFYKNDAAFGSAVELPSWDIAVPMIRKGGSSHTSSFNFGSPSFAISSGNADANGYGNFEYAVPSGYYALCTKNLAEYG